MKSTRVILIVTIVVLAAVPLLASGPLGIYGIVEKVVFEPNETAPERVQVWGAFAYVDGGPGGLSVSVAKRGYLYFKTAVPGFRSESYIDAVKKEWADLKAVAGTGQAIGFGSWGYIGRFDLLRPDARAEQGVPIIYESRAGGGDVMDLRVRPATEAPSKPAAYQTNVGIVKLSDRGSHADIVKQLRAALNK